MQISVSAISEEKDLEKAYSIRKQVFVVGQGVPADEEYDEFDKTSHHFLVKSGGKAVGTARWRRTRKGAKLERFAVLEEYRNKGIGALLLKEVLQEVPKDVEVYLHSQLPAMGLYERAGFAAVGDPFMECDISHYKMVWKG